MDVNVVIGVSLALLGAVFLNIGKGVEKMKVQVFTKGWDMFKQPHIKDLGIWSTGILLTLSFGVLQWLAMRFVNNPSLVTAMSGFGLVALVLFAVKIIGEHINVREIISIAIIMIATFFMSYYQAPTKEMHDYNLTALLIGTLVPISFFGLLSVYALFTKKLHGFAWGAFSGSCNAIPSLLLKVSWVVVGTEVSVFEQLKHPYIYLALLVGIIATATSQVGFWRDRAIIVVPTFISFNMIVPAVVEYFVFGVSLYTIQFIAMGGIIVGVILLSLSTPEAVLAVDLEEAAEETESTG